MKATQISNVQINTVLPGFAEWFEKNHTEIQQLFDGIQPMPLTDEETGLPILDEHGQPFIVTNTDLFDDVEGMAIELFMEQRGMA